VGKTWEQMTERERDAWVAERVMGWKTCHNEMCQGCDASVWLSESGWWVIHPESDEPWNPTTDLNHAAEAEAAIERRGLRREYAAQLAGLVGHVDDMDLESFWFRLAIATAAQRCEAMWRTVGGEGV